jgi:hypothetical protein
MPQLVDISGEKSEHAEILEYIGSSATLVIVLSVVLPFVVGLCEFRFRTLEFDGTHGMHTQRRP